MVKMWPNLSLNLNSWDPRSCPNTHIHQYKLAIVLILIVFVNIVGVKSQIRVLQPRSLVELYRGGVIRGSTAAFGTPLWGEQLIGKLAYNHSKGEAYCTADDYDLEPDTDSRFPRIVLVRRGQCHFVSKVRAAQEAKDAAAVIVVDEEGSGKSPEEIRGVIMADDGRGSNIKIPSVLISDIEGSPLINAVKAKQNVIVEMIWDMPNEAVVEVDSWICPAISSSLNFLKEFAPYAKRFKHKLSFRPHYWVFGLPADYTDMCLDTSGRYCSMSADWAQNVTGKRVLQESLRQLCLWHETRTINASLPNSGEYSEVWWNYIERSISKCASSASTRSVDDGKDADYHSLSRECSYDVMEEVGAPVGLVKKCEEERATDILFVELLNHAWSPTAIMVNGARFSGPLDPGVVLQAICTGYVAQPKECQELRNSPPKPSDYYIAIPRHGRVAWWVYALSIALPLAICIGTFLCYRNCIMKRLRSELRYEVFEEVKSQMKGLDGSFLKPEDKVNASSRETSTGGSLPGSSGIQNGNNFATNEGGGAMRDVRVDSSQYHWSNTGRAPQNFDEIGKA